MPKTKNHYTFELLVGGLRLGQDLHQAREDEALGRPEAIHASVQDALGVLPHLSVLRHRQRENVLDGGDVDRRQHVIAHSLNTLSAKWGKNAGGLYDMKIS